MMTRLRLVLERLEWAGLSAKASKCILFSISVPYLGHVISRDGLEMDPAKIEKITAIKPTEICTLLQVRSFLGLCSYYRRFIKGFARITAVLTDLTRDGVDVAVESQKPEAQLAISTLITAITSEPVILRMPRFDRMFLVKTDAAKTEGLGGVLGQADDEGHERVVAYYGRRLTTAERNYTVTEIELLAALESIRTWRPYLWGRPFKLIVDHAALRWLHTMKDTIEGGPASRLMRWILKLQEYQFEVEHKPGVEHTDADGVSRLVAPVSQLNTTDTAAATTRLVGTLSRVATSIPDHDPRIAGNKYVNPDGRPSRSRLLLLLDTTVQSPDPLVYTWYHEGLLDTPGATRSTQDECDADALVRACQHHLTFPEGLLRRISNKVTPTAKPTFLNWTDSCSEPLAVYTLAASREEVDAIRLNVTNPIDNAAMRPLSSLGLPASSIRCLPDSCLESSHLPRTPTPTTPEALLQGTRLAFLDWSVSPGVCPTSFEEVRQNLIAAVWDHTPIPDLPPTTPAVTAAARAATDPANANHASRTGVTTSRSLQRAERLLADAETTRQSIVRTYINVDTPNNDAMLKAQSVDPNCRAIRAYLTTGHADAITGTDSLRLCRWVQRETPFIRILDGGLLYRVDPQSASTKRQVLQLPSTPRLYVPHALRNAYLYAFHERFGHPGKDRMFHLLRARFYWPGLHADIVRHVRECHDCTLAKRLTRSLASPERSEFGSYPFDNLTVDVVEMGITTDGKFDKLLVFADSLSRWIEAVPFLGDPTAEQVLDAFVCHVACRYGWPRTIRSDGGSNLANVLITTLLQHTGVDFRQGAAYHSQSQGIAERVQQTLIQMTRASNEGGGFWHDHLPFLLFSYHATPHRVTGLSPAMLMYGRALRLPAQRDSLSGTNLGYVDDTPLPVQDYAKRHSLLLRSAWEAASTLTDIAQEHSAADSYTTSNTSVTFAVGDRVCYRLFDKKRKLMSSWFGPCRVLAVLERGNYELRDLPNQMVQSKFHVSHLRAYHATLPSDVLAPDEYIVDAIRDRRTRSGATQYLVKWRGYALSKSTWEPRNELLRRCRDEVNQFEDTMPRPPPKPPIRREMTASPPAGAPETDDVQVDLAPNGNELPHEARLVRGKWLYARQNATKRGIATKWHNEDTFTSDERATPHFSALRERAKGTTPTPSPREISPTRDAPVIAAAARPPCLPRLDPPFDGTQPRFFHPPYGRPLAPAEDTLATASKRPNSTNSDGTTMRTLTLPSPVPKVTAAFEQLDPTECHATKPRITAYPPAYLAAKGSCKGRGRGQSSRGRGGMNPLAPQIRDTLLELDPRRLTGRG